MVSQFDPPSQQHPRRPSSVTSRASSSRRHRSSRSHHASSSSPCQNEFPYFSLSGDVDITITSANGRKEQRYLLHRLILSQSSGFFELDTNHHAASGTAISSSGRPQTAASASAPTHPPLSKVGDSNSSRSSLDSAHFHHTVPQTDRKRWRYALDWGNAADHELPILVQQDTTPIFELPGPPPVARNKPPASSSAFFRSMSNFSALNLNSQPTNPAGPHDEIFRDYDNLFRIFYNYPPALDSVNVANAYSECKALLHLADMYDALDIVGPRVDHHLIRFQGRLFKQIAKYPPSYLKLAYLAQSKTIFAEALIHVVGQWPLGAPQLERQIDISVIDLIEDKVDELDELKSKIEAKLFRLTLTTSRGERVTPSNSFLDWLAMSLFRQWIAENTTPLPASILKDSSSFSSSPSTLQQQQQQQHHHHHQRQRGSSFSSSSSSSRPHPPHHYPGLPQPPAPPAPPPPPALTTGRLYRLLGSTSNSAYLAHDELKRFLKLTPELYTRDNLRRFERRMDEVKNLARDIVRPLTRNCLELDLGSLGNDSSGDGGGSGGGAGGGAAAAAGGTVSGSGSGAVGGARRGSGLGSLGYLTCTKVLDVDFPWDD